MRSGGACAGKPVYALPRRSPPCPRGHGGRPGHPVKENLCMSLINEFKAFAVRGNVVDMAVGIVIGAAVGKIVSSFVDGVIMPPLGLLIGGVDFSDQAVAARTHVELVKSGTVSVDKWGRDVN